MEFENKTAIVTGGSSGIGLLFAQCFVKEGGNVVIVGRNAEILLDPVMYVPKEHWQSIAKCPKGFENKKYIFEYFIGESKAQWSVEEFLYLIDHAEKVITNSFHVCVFAVIFGKEFEVTERNGLSMQSRFDTLFEKINEGIDIDTERRKTDKFILSALGGMT